MFVCWLSVIRCLIVTGQEPWIGFLRRLLCQWLRSSRFKERAGGAGNVAANIASLGAGSQLLSFVGDDDAGRRVNSILELAGVDRHLHIDPSSRTTEKLRIVSRNQQLLRADFEDRPDSDLLARSVTDFRELLNGADVVVISDYGKGGLANVVEMIGALRKSAASR